MPKVTAQLNNLRIAPRKVRAVVELLKGLDVDQALAQLKYLTRRPANPILKLLNSAVANAGHNSGLDKNYLYIKELVVNEGMKLKRYKPKGFGMAMPIQKKTSHIKIVLDELSGDRRKKKEELMARMPKVIPSPAKPPEIEKEPKKGISKEAKAETPKFGKEVEKVSKKGVFGGVKSFGRKLFQRKSV